MFITNEAVSTVKQSNSRTSPEENEGDGIPSLKDLPKPWYELSEEERQERLMHENVDIEVLKVFSKIKEYKFAVALSENTPEEILSALRSEGEFFVCQALIKRCLPVSIRCLNDSDICEKISLGYIDNNALETLTSANAWYIREAVVEAPNATNATLQKLLLDGDPSIHSKAARRLIPDKIKNMPKMELLEQIKSSKIDQDLLEIIGKANDWKTRYIIHSYLECTNADYDLNSETAFAYQCLDALDGDEDLILGAEDKLIIIRTGLAGDETYYITLEKVVLNEEGEAEGYEQVCSYFNSLGSIEKAICDFISEGGSKKEILDSLPT